jgi:isoamylase
VPDAPRFYMDTTGTGNTLNVAHPQVLQMVMDSLRYWVQEMHVDGFRFDLASTLAASPGVRAALLLLRRDPAGSRSCQREADRRAVGHRRGRVPGGELPRPLGRVERQVPRHGALLLAGRPGAADLGYRLTGSSDLYESDGRRPHASINFIVAHDGFTLADLVSYNHKHNEANGENNHDGHDHNLSYNFGVEGPTDRPDILRARERQRRNLIATLLLSQGVPMICGGDEMGRTQGGNNNAYAQDNEISWLHWDLSESDRELLEFTRRVARLRREHPTFRRRRFFRGRKIRGSDVRDLVWLSPDGTEMTDEEWNAGFVRCFGMALGGEAMEEWNERGERITDDNFLLLFNADGAPIDFTMPDFGHSRGWRLVFDTARPELEEGSRELRDGDTLTMEGRSMVVLIEDGVPG